jgi:hypothetical protein
MERVARVPQNTPAAAMLEHTISPIWTKVNMLKALRFARYRSFLVKCRQKFFSLHEPICQRIPLLVSEQQAFKASVLK